MIVLGNRILVSKVEEEKKEGFQTVEVQDSFLYKGKVEQIGTVDSSLFVAKGTIDPGILNTGSISSTMNADPLIKEGSIVLFTKYCPHTQSITHEGVDYKVIRMEDVIAVL